MKKICVVTGTRAEYGLLKPVIDKINKDPDFKLQLVVTGAHLSPEFGLTYKEIEEDGYPIARKIEMLLSADTNSSIVKSMGVELISFADTLDTLNPDFMILLGDRYECLVAAEAAMIFKIPIAHIHGGETTEGAIDESIRHAITKMSYLHFASTEAYRNRIIQLGENPERVYNVGALGVENIKLLKLMDKQDLEDALDFKIVEPTAMVTFHPETLDDKSSKEQFENLLKALDKSENLRIIFTKSNADADGRVINSMIDEFVANNSDRCAAYNSLGQLKYLSALKYCDMVIGNSSSGIVEAPSFHIPTINIGDRQKGRVAAESVINCDCDANIIIDCINKAMSKEFNSIIETCRNPYECKDTANKIIDILKNYLKRINLPKKQFYDSIKI